jgi:hypothetical protein
MAGRLEYPSWDEWTAGPRPRVPQDVRVREVQGRFSANGCDWDVHGTLVTPTGVTRAAKFVLTHGGAGSEKELTETPDGRPGLALLLAQQGYESLAISFVGHYPAGGVWSSDVAHRMPVYLFDRILPDDEIRRRNLICTFDVHVQGMAALIDELFANQCLIAFGHSTGGPMIMALPRFLRRNAIAGVVGWGSGEPNLWGSEWANWVHGKPVPAVPLDSVSRRTPEWFKATGYEDDADLCPWGGSSEYARWADRNKSQFKTSLCDNQHHAIVETFPAYAEASGLPLEAYTAYLRDPDPAWLSRIGVMLMVGEKDSRLWGAGRTPRDNRQLFASAKYELRAKRLRTIVVPRFGHFGFAGLHNEQIAYRWVAAVETGFFD